MTGRPRKDTWMTDDGRELNIAHTFLDLRSMLFRVLYLIRMPNFVHMERNAILADGIRVKLYSIS